MEETRNDKGQFIEGNTIGKENRFEEGKEKTGGRKKKTPEELWGLFQEYLKQCKKEKKGLTVQGICRSLGMSRFSFAKYYKKDPLYSHLIEKIYIEIEEWWTQYGLTGKATAFVIFYLKNFFNWKDDRSLRFGGMPEDEAGVIRIITSLPTLKDAINGSVDTDEETG